MLLDSQLFFTAAPPGDAITAGGAGTHVIDLLGMGVGNASTNRIGNTTVFGEDLGALGAGNFMQLGCYVETTFLPTTASLNIQFQAAPDNGTANPGAWTTYAESGAIAGTSLVAPAKVFAIAWPLRLIWPTNATPLPLPRFIRLNFAVTAGPFTGGVMFAGMLATRDDWTAYPNNFVAAA